MNKQQQNYHQMILLISKVKKDNRTKHTGAENAESVSCAFFAQQSRQNSGSVL